jgi:hypothetical protein
MLVISWVTYWNFARRRLHALVHLPEALSHLLTALLQLQIVLGEFGRLLQPLVCDLT